ncbi:hypothetical protein C900_04695 [Fulvivirga imtechensis AK7]|uniref:Uncharacterized protein n=1 Tax=Fulvivirga imtechensis AK7 TaxID=1237149 RepID=L8JNF6_9BACT|nr:hypothetical protein C900_04695 [Fulvivirga imtechensis AK7]
MKIFILLSYYKRLIFRNPKLYFYFITSFIVYFIVVGMLIFLQTVETLNLYFHRLLIFSYIFQFYYNHLYYGLGWESSFRHFVAFQIRMKNIIYMYIFLNLSYFVFSFILIKAVSLTPWLIVDYSIFNIIILYFIIPNLLFLIVFPLLTIYVDLFNSKKGLVIHKFYGFPLLVLTIAFPAMFQYLWSNFSVGPELISCLSIVFTIIVISRFSRIVKFWEDRLLQIKAE